MPFESVAVALIVCVPFEKRVVFQLTSYGEVVSFTPVEESIWKDTPDTAVLSEAVADMVTVVPLTVVPEVGVVRDTVSGVVSTGGGGGVGVVVEGLLSYW